MKSEIFDPNNYKKCIDIELKMIKKSTWISKENKEVIYKFIEHCKDKELSLGRIFIYLYFLRVTANELGKMSFKEANEFELRKIYRYLKEKWKSDESKRLYLSILSCFYRWLFKTDSCPQQIKWIKEVQKGLKHVFKSPEEMLTEEEILKMIDKEKSFRNKTIISILFYSGCRLSEFLRLRIKDVVFDDLGAVLYVQQTKGGYRIRRIRIIEGSQFLRVYINQHPFKNDPESPLWITENKENKRLAKNDLEMIVKRAAMRAGINKRVTVHVFRHSRATDLAKKGFNECQLREFFGWSRNSTEPSTYVHLASSHLDDALVKSAGLQINEGKNQMKLKKCVRCGEINDASAVFCVRCGWNLRENILTLLKEDIQARLDRNDNNNNENLLLKKRCPRCGYLNPITNKFCGECGILLYSFQNQLDTDDIKRIVEEEVKKLMQNLK
jgi:site-specific recombinase XerD/ribosomal protein L40E